jgi:hypothetical protein
MIDTVLARMLNQVTSVNHVSQSSNGLLDEKYVRKKVENFVETPPETSQ